jgi:iron complex outermembrane receptor protein
MYRLVLLPLVLLAANLFAQNAEEQADSTRVLEEVVVSAYQSNRRIEEVPASVGVVDSKLMNRFPNTSFVSAANTVPGVRMEERSPGSYRFSIRGSLLRSPFGVRNVKFYWRGLPFTDGGGNTYLNLLDFSSVKSMEIIKGPGSSLYGAGTGGTVLLKPETKGGPESMGMSFMGGSYGTYQMVLNSGTLPVFNKNAPPSKPVWALGLDGCFQGSKGYREHTAMGRFNGTIRFSRNSQKSSFNLVMFSGQLWYETPGGLTKTQFEDDPRQARPSTPATPTRPAVPGAVDQNAHIQNKTSYIAATHDQFWNDHWSSTIGVFGSFTEFINPAILNYEHRDEGNIGTRATIDYFFGEDSNQKITFGAEGQFFNSKVDVSTNNAGSAGTLSSTDDLTSQSAFTFLQADLKFPYDFHFTAGGSANFLTYDMERNFPVDYSQARNFKPGFFPRIALLKEFYKSVSAYVTVSEGFSAPAFAEVLPNTGVYNSNLNPERGTNLEAGIKGSFFKRSVKFEAAFYDFRLTDAIVNVSGGDNYQNAGETSQKGIELTASWSPVINKNTVRLWSSYSYNNYHFVDYVREGNDYSGNELTGVPRQVFVGGLDFVFRRGWYINTTVNYTDQIPLNDQNSEYAASYLLIGGRAGIKFIARRLPLELFVAMDNALDANYSLGNDLNAAGGRYYNAAFGRSYYFGLILKMH